MKKRIILVLLCALVQQMIAQVTSVNPLPNVPLYNNSVVVNATTGAVQLIFPPFLNLSTGNTAGSGALVTNTFNNWITTTTNAKQRSVLWGTPGIGVTGTGTALITNFSITSGSPGTAIFTASNSFLAGQQVVISGLLIGTDLNSRVLTVSTSGLSSSGFQASLIYPTTVVSTPDTGLATPSGAPTSALGSLERIFDARGTNCMDQLGGFSVADNSICVEAAEDRQDSTAIYTHTSDFRVAYDSIMGGVYNFNGSTGVKSTRTALPVTMMHSTVAQNYGVDATMTGLAGGESIGLSSSELEYGGYVGSGQEPHEGIRISQQQPLPTATAGYGNGSDGFGGVWQATATNKTGGVVTFAPTYGVVIQSQTGGNNYTNTFTGCTVTGGTYAPGFQATCNVTESGGVASFSIANAGIYTSGASLAISFTGGSPGTGASATPGLIASVASANANTLGESRFIRDLNPSTVTTGTYSAVSCSGSGPTSCTITGTSFPSPYSPTTLRTTYNSLATGGNILTNNLIFCAAPGGSNLTVGGAGFDACVPITLVTSSTSLTVNLYGTGTQANTLWPWGFPIVLSPTSTGSGYSGTWNCSVVGGAYTVQAACSAALSGGGLNLSLPSAGVYTSSSGVSLVLSPGSTGMCSPCVQATATFALATTANYAIYGSAYPTAVGVASNNFTAGDVSGIGSLDALDQVLAYNADFDGIRILQEKQIGTAGYGGVNVVNQSPPTSPAFNYGLSVSGNYECALCVQTYSTNSLLNVALGSPQTLITTYARPATGQASIVDASPTDSSSPVYGFYQSRMSDGFLHDFINIDPNTSHSANLSLFDGKVTVAELNGSLTANGGVNSKGGIDLYALQDAMISGTNYRFFSLFLNSSIYSGGAVTCVLGWDNIPSSNAAGASSALTAVQNTTSPFNCPGGWYVDISSAGTTTSAPNLLGNVAVSSLSQTAANSTGGTCTMTGGTSCPITIGRTYTTPVCIATVQGITVGGASLACSVSGTTVTITTSVANSLTWGAFVFGNPN